MILDEDLKFGTSGNDVLILQEKLKLLGYFNPIVNGSFGPATEEGVKQFQRDYNLDVTGIVNQKMWSLLFNLTENEPEIRQNYPILELGSNNQYVRELQIKLRTLLYYPGEITGYFDRETENAVKRFQYNNGITTTGIVNYKVWNKINELYGYLNKCVTQDNEFNGNENIINNYIVVAGDTLYSIARRFNTTVDEIKKANGLVNNTLTIGQSLIIPSIMNNDNSNNNVINYTVVPGDTLYSIARRFNTSVDEIKRANGLVNNTLTIGQSLIIPSNMNNNLINYTVVAGDTLYSIATRFNTSVNSIYTLNNLNSNILSIGQVLKIPII